MRRAMMMNRRECLVTSALGLAGISTGAHAMDFEPPTVEDNLRGSAERAELSMQFRGESKEEVVAWQRSFETKLRTLLGPHQPPKEWRTVVENEVELDDHVRKELLLVADGHPTLPVYLLEPKGKRRGLAGVLAIHGHGNYGYDPVAGRDDLPGVADAIRSANYDYGRQLVRRGYAVACPCLTPFGRRLGKREAYGGSDPCAVTFVRLQLLGRVLMAENLRDCLWAFEMLARNNRVDQGRMACVGLSYGGRMTMLTSALEKRIKVAVVSGALNVMQERIRLRYSCGGQVIPGLLQYGDVPEISSLIAPRHCVFEVGSSDGLIKPDWAELALQRVRRAYDAFDAAKSLHVDNFEGSHRWNGTVAYPLLERALA